MSGFGILLIVAAIVIGFAAQAASGFVKLLLLVIAMTITVVLLAMVARKLYRIFRAQ